MLVKIEKKVRFFLYKVDREMLLVVNSVKSMEWNELDKIT